jgi:hypothetical protein
MCDNDLDQTVQHKCTIEELTLSNPQIRACLCAGLVACGSSLGRGQPGQRVYISGDVLVLLWRRGM